MNQMYLILCKFSRNRNFCLSGDWKDRSPVEVYLWKAVRTIRETEYLEINFASMAALVKPRSPQVLS